MNPIPAAPVAALAARPSGEPGSRAWKPADAGLRRRRTFDLARCFAVLALTAPVAVLAATVDDARPRFRDVVTAAVHPSADAPGDPVLLRWDLRTARQVLYTLEQSEVQSTTQRLHGRARTFERDSEALGAMVVHARGSGLSTEVRIQDVVMENTVSVDGRSESSTSRLPVLIASGLTENGAVRGRSGALAPSSVDNFVTALFALPAAALAPGASDDVPVRFGAALQWGEERGAMATFPVVVEGRATVTFTGYERLEHCTCARLEIAFDLASKDKPKGFPGEARVVVRGVARTWFDVGARRMTEGVAAFLLGIGIDAPDQSSGDTGLTILTDTLTRVRIGR